MTDQKSNEEQVQERHLPVGKILAAARAEQGLSADTIAARLCLTESYINAIESGNYEALPGDTFVRGYLRNYADIVGLNGEELVRIYLEQKQPMSSEEDSNGQSAKNVGKAGVVIAVLIVVVLLVVFLVKAFSTDENASTDLSQDAVSKQVEKQADSEIAINDKESGTEREISSDLTDVRESVTDETVTEETVSKETLPEENVILQRDLNNTLEAELDTSALSVDSSVDQANSTVEVIQRTPNEAEGVLESAQQTIDEVNNDIVPSASAEIQQALNKDELIFRFNGTCWYQVIDSAGTLLAERTKSAGDVSTISGFPPFKVTLGDSTVVNMTHNGTSVDLSPYFQRKLARLTVGD